MKTRIVHILLVVLLLSGLVACCGPRQKETIKIVTSLPFDAQEGSGTAWALRHAMQLALEEAEYQAGDFTVEFEAWNSADETGMPDAKKDEEYAKQAAADPAVLVYMGGMTSGGCKLMIPILNRAGMAQLSATANYAGLTKVGFAAGEPAIYYPSGERTFFRVVTTGDMQGPAGALWAKDLGLSRIYVVEQDDIYGQGLANAFRQTAGVNGLTIVGTSVITQDQMSGLEEIVANIADQQADLVYQAGFEGAGTALFRAMQDGGVEARLMMNALPTADYMRERGVDDPTGILSTFVGVPVEGLNQASQDFIRRFEERFGYELGSGRAFWAILAYDSMRIALAAIERAGKADRAAVVQAVRETDFEGLLGRWSFDENGDARLLLVTGFHFENGEWKSDGLLRVR